uniref:Phosphodiesterase n=2 Tax=Eptatretus burgeri TaxID=7764 RepID=A0A8C4NAS4_EPTBU
MGQTCGHSFLCRSEQHQQHKCRCDNRRACRGSAEDTPGVAPPRALNGDFTLPAPLQDALLLLAGVLERDALPDAVHCAIRTVLPHVEEMLVYILDPAGTCFRCHDPLHSLPTDGPIGDVLEKPVLTECDGLPAHTILHPALTPLAVPLPPDKIVEILPVVDSNNAVLLVVLMRCSPLNTIEKASLVTVAKSISVCCKRVHNMVLTASSQASVAKGQNLVSHDDGETFSYMDRKILQLCAELSDLDAASLQLKVIQYLQRETDSSCCCLLLFSEETQLLSCQVVGDKILEEDISFPLGSGLMEKLVEEKTSAFLVDTDNDVQQMLSSQLDFPVHSMLCVPVLSRATGQVVALACAFNKLHGQSFSQEDEKMIQHCFCYTSTVLTSTLAFQKEQKLKLECQALLQVAKNLFTHLDDVTVLLYEIIQEARNLSNAESCSIFLLERGRQELVAKVFDGGVVDDESYEVRIPANQGIAGHVATTGQVLNIKDAYSHPLFYRGVDDSTGFHTRNILCFPIKDENEEVIGVAELCNKINGPWFSKFDEDLATAFSIYCGISIAHSLLYKKVFEAQHRSKLSNEMMMYHMKVSYDEITKVLSEGVVTPTAIHSDFAELHYTPRSLPDERTLPAVLSMFADMGFISKYKLDTNTLTWWCLMVKKGYRDPPYHNWMHAYSVSHFCYLLDKNLDLSKYLDDIEIFALFTSCLCHDLDHRGTNNSFQVDSQSVLAALYSSEGSVMERHHFAQAMAIINTEGCNIFENFSRKEYQRMLDLMRDIILATDLAHHLRILKDLRTMADMGYNKHNPEHHNLLLCLLMTSSDLSDQTKGWKTTRKIAELIYKEFFSQGDLEKAMGNRPSEMMDREKAYIPELQISFMEHIAMPVYRLLKDLLPGASELYERVSANRDHWAHVSHKFTIRGLPSDNSLDFLDEDAGPGQIAPTESDTEAINSNGLERERSPEEG